MTHLRDFATDHPFPSPATVRLGDIWRDPQVAYIPLREDNVEKLRAEFKAHLVGAPIVSKREDGQIVVLNGSHRCEMLRAMFGDDLEIDVSMFVGLTRDQETAIFERHHKAFLPQEQRKGDAEADDESEAHVWTWDIDDTITAAPRQHARIAQALRSLGDKVICVTGHGPEQTRAELLDVLAFPYDAIVIVDPQADGSGKAKTLKHLGSWFHFDNSLEFGPEIIDVCPVTFQYVEPAGDVKPKHAAEKAHKALKGSRMQAVGRPDRFHVVRGDAASA